MGRLENEGPATNLSDQIDKLKYAIVGINAFLFMAALSVFGLCLWLLFDQGISEWIRELELQKFYIGIYVLILATIVMMISVFLGCLSTYSESRMFMFGFTGSQIFCFLCGAVGTAVILEYSTQYSHIQPMIRESMRRLIINAHHEPSRKVLSIIQENIGCCGADGPVDYTSLHQPLPSQCRDTVTGNPFFHGCVDELTWFFEDKTTWIAVLTMIVCFFHILNIAMSFILMRALDLETEMFSTYK